MELYKKNSLQIAEQCQLYITTRRSQLPPLNLVPLYFSVHIVDFLEVTSIFNGQKLKKQDKMIQCY